MKDLELLHQGKVVMWCRDNGIMIGALAQSTWTESWSVIQKNKKAGVVRGLPDLMIIIPSKYRKNGMNKTVMLEMKRLKGGVVSEYQKKWIDALNKSEGIVANVCRGHEEAIEWIKSFLEVKPKLPEGEELENLIHNL